MAIVEMCRLSLIGLNSDKDMILKELMKLGVLEIIDLQQENDAGEISSLAEKDGDTEEVAELENELARVKGALDFLYPYRPKQRKGLFASKRSVSSEYCERIAKNRQKLMEVIEQVFQFSEKLNALKNEENWLNNLIAFLEPWKGYRLPLEVTQTKSTCIMAGTMPLSVDEEALRLELVENAPESSLNKIGQDKEQSYFYIIFHKSLEGIVNEILKKYGFSKADFRDISGTAESNISKSLLRIKEIHNERKLVQSQIAQAAEMVDDLEILYDQLSLEAERKKALFRLIRTNNTFMLEGWLPADECGKVKAKLERKWDCIIEFRKPKADEEYPILLKNNAVVRPFEMITRFYSLPKPGGIDPSAFLAPFYCVFFGIMLSDAGYGIVLTIAGGLMLLKYKSEGIIRDMSGLMFFCGISTAFWGAMFGSWFGNIADVLVGRENVIPPLWFAPLNDPMKLLVWSLIFGAIQIFTAMGLKMYMLIRERKYFDAVFDVGSWYLVLAGLATLALGGATADFGKYIALTGVLMLVLTQGRSQKGIIKKFLVGVLSLYNITGYFGDILSYSRLLALGLATGVIANVVNTMGALAGKSVFGILVLLVIFAVGHVFNLLINVLGSYVHSSRLQYVEFFGRFYESGGRMFQPFKRNTKYINLQDEEDN